MILFPAIDLKGGEAVRLLRGEMAEATVFDRDPAARAAAFAAEGAEWLHLVDLDGAFAGEARNAPAVEAILRAVRVPVQLGGGLRDRAGIERWLERGVARVVLGTAAVEDPGLVRGAARDFPGRVAVRGWAEEGGVTALDLARRFEDAGVAAIAFTDIARDGAMGGPNVAATAAMAAAVSVPVIASGGVSSLADLAALRGAGGIAGAIVGRALYEGAFSLREALG